MKVKKIPMRSCVVTHEKLEKKDLIRIVKTKDGDIFVDETGKANGKGAYLKKDINVIRLSKEKKILDKVFEMEVKDEVYKSLEDIVEK